MADSRTSVSGGVSDFDTVSESHESTEPSKARDLYGVAEAAARSGTVVSPDDTRTLTSQELEHSGVLRSHARQLHDDSALRHQDALRSDLERRTLERAKQRVTTLLDYLAEEGFSWHDLARLVGVSVPALRKWRQGQNASPSNRRRVAQLAAFCDIATTEYLVQDIASWMEVRPVERAPITCVDIYAAGHVELLMEYVAGFIDTTELLDRFDPDWREASESVFEVFDAEDGYRSIRLRD